MCPGSPRQPTPRVPCCVRTRRPLRPSRRAPSPPPCRCRRCRPLSGRPCPPYRRSPRPSCSSSKHLTPYVYHPTRPVTVRGPAGVQSPRYRPVTLLQVEGGILGDHPQPVVVAPHLHGRRRGVSPPDDLPFSLFLGSHGLPPSKK